MMFNRAGISHNRASLQEITYLWQLPYAVRRQFCEILDADKSWRQLGGEYASMSETELELLSHAVLRKESPTHDLLIKWEQSNPTVSQLYSYLAKMGHKRAMLLLKPYVAFTLQAMCLEQNDHNILEHRYSPNEHVSPRPVESVRVLQPQGHPDSASVPLHASQNGFSAAASTVAAYDDDTPYSELLAATDNFCKSNVIGCGGFGVVYKGFWKGTKVAIKRLKDCSNSAQAITELRVLSQYRIDNIVPLYGICLDGPEPCLIYQYMVNGSLENRLQCKNFAKPLSFHQRLVIGEGVAKALNYLHTRKGKPLVHGDVKSANVLLDAQMQPKLGDFGLAKVLQAYEGGQYTHMTVTSVHGTLAYLPPEYLRSKILSPAVDAYSYGVVLLEMATGRRAFDGKYLLIETLQDELDVVCSCATRAREDDFQRPSETAASALERKLGPLLERQMCGDCAQKLKDARVQDAEFNMVFEFLLSLGMACSRKSKRKRPSFTQVLELFEDFDRTRQSGFPMAPFSWTSRTLSATPLEQKLWNEIVRRESESAANEPVASSARTEITDIGSQRQVGSVAEPSDLTIDKSTSNCIIPLLTELGITGEVE